MWLGVGALLLIVWAVSFVVYKAAGWAIHLLILGAVIAGVIHLVRWMKNRSSS
jgi:hypothetical protein